MQPVEVGEEVGRKESGCPYGRVVGTLLLHSLERRTAQR